MCCKGCCDCKGDEIEDKPQGDMDSPSGNPGHDNKEDSPASDDIHNGSHEPSVPHPGRRRRIRRLWCQTGFDLAIYPNGAVRGTQSPTNKYALLEFEAVGLEGHIRIKGTTTGFYVTMTPKGRIHAQPLATNRGTVWVETGMGSGTTYHSLLSLDYAHKGYYLAIKKNGKPKEGPRTAHPHPQKATSFLSRIVAEE